MLKTLIERCRQKNRTIRFPKTEPTLPERFRGAPRIARGKCAAECAECGKVCPTGAVKAQDGAVAIDMGLCLFCGECAEVCPAKRIEFTKEYSLSANKRANLVVNDEFQHKAEALDGYMKGLFGRSLKLRQVSAGGCDGCEPDINVLTTVVFDLGRFGIQIVASPRHADGLLVTGPVTRNMRLALQKTYDAVPPPKLVIAVGACAISGGLFRGGSEVCDGAESILPVDLHIPGCPPHPVTILDGLLRLLGRIPKARLN